MDENRRMTKKELKVLRRLERMEQEKQGAGGDKTKLFIIAIGSALFLAFFAFIVILIKQSKNKPVEISSSGWVRGTEDAKTTLVEYGDLQCPACRGAEPLIRQALVDFDGKLKFVFKHFPLKAIHPNALISARAAEAAGAQNKFWEMHDFLYDKQDSWAPLSAVEAKERMVDQAKALGLDVEKFSRDMDSEVVTSKISSNETEGINLGVNSTPTFYINNKKVESNPTSYEEFKKIIEESLK